MSSTEISWQKMQVERLFAAFDRTPSATQVTEWIDAVGKFRVDDATNAIGVLISNGSRLPTISVFRTEAMRFYGMRIKQDQQLEVSPILAKIQRDAEAENRRFWAEKFGDRDSDSSRRMIGEICVVAKYQRKTAERVAELLNAKITPEARAKELIFVATQVEIADEAELRRRLVASNGQVLSTSEKLLLKKTIEAYLEGW
jgi:DNA-directed RNA polymerase subunit F